MARSAVAILTQVKGLLSEFHDTEAPDEVKQEVADWVDKVDSDIEQLHQHSAPDAPEHDPEQMPPPMDENSKEGGFKAARKAAMDDHKKSGNFFGRRGPNPPPDKPGEADPAAQDAKENPFPNRRKKAKAY